MIPSPIHEVVDGLPPRVDQMHGHAGYVLDYYGIQLEYWFDLLTASSLYCREYVAELLQRFHVLPQRLMTRVTSRPWFRERCNSIGKRTRIHPTAILEGCVVGADVEIGAFAYLRSAVIGNGAVIRERSTVTMSFVGARAFLGGCDVLNTLHRLRHGDLRPEALQRRFRGARAARRRERLRRLPRRERTRRCDHRG